MPSLSVVRTESRASGLVHSLVARPSRRRSLLARTRTMPAAPATFETFQQELARLVDKFDRDYPQFVAANYNEATLRNEFLDPFYRALGWDVGNVNGLIHTEREVDIGVRVVV